MSRFRRRHDSIPDPPPADLEAADAALAAAKAEGTRVQALWLPTKTLSARLRQQRVENHFAARFEAAYHPGKDYVMNHAADVLLALTAIVWWTAVLWYGSRFPRLKLTAHSWNLILTGLLIACVVTEEVVIQRWYGGWAYHHHAIAVFVIWGGALGVERLVFLWLTRRPRRKHPDALAADDRHAT